MEVIFALVIVVAAITIAGNGFSLGSRASVGAQKRTRAVWLAQSLVTDLEIGARAVNMGGEGAFEGDDAAFTYRIESNLGEEVDLYHLTVTVLWRQRGREQSYTLHRLLYRPQESP